MRIPRFLVGSLVAVSGLGFSLVGSLGLAAQAGEGSHETPVVVELFTSQGCDVCPAADALLGELATRSDILALSFHVSYWDYIGWRDPFAIPQAVARQRGYAKPLGQRMLYTPQFVIDGTVSAMADDKAALEQKIAAATHRREELKLVFRRDSAGRFWVSLPARNLRKPAVVWLVLYDRTHRTAVTRGENVGKSLIDVNVVREMRAVGEWRGADEEIPLGLGPDAAEYDSCAIIVQEEAMGPILGAIAVPAADWRGKPDDPKLRGRPAGE
jgi:hypothetical protein